MSQTEKILLRKIGEYSVHIAVIGLGYVGLPLAMTFAEAGFQVTGIDIDREKVEQGNRGESYISDISSNDVKRLVEAKRLCFTSDYAVLAEIDAVSICVPTPLDNARAPDLSYIRAAVQQVTTYLHPGQLITLESTTYPGTTEEVVLPALEVARLKVGEDFFLAYSPERIDPGNKQFDTRTTPKVVGGITPACSKLAQTLYSAAVEHVVPVSSTKSAEMTKLLENTFRAVNIGLINEIAIMCNMLDIDVWEVIHAAATKPFGFMPFLPGPGLGGHCIPVDPQYLSWKLRTLDYTARFIEIAAEINGRMPQYVLDKINIALNEQKLSFKGSTILVLGVAYKRNIRDMRESPALNIIKGLLARNATVLYNDEYIAQISVNKHVLISQPLNREILRNADCVVIVTDHSYYNTACIVREARYIVDTRNTTRGYNNANIVRL